MDAILRAAYLLLLGHLWASVSPASSCRVHIPPHDQVARVARFVAHQCDWASMATISTHKPVVGQPFSNAFSVSDGAEGSSSGVPYMYLTRMEISVQDLEVINVCCVYQYNKVSQAWTVNCILVYTVCSVQYSFWSFSQTFIVFLVSYNSLKTITAIIWQTLLKYIFSSYFSSTVKNLQHVNIILILHTKN